MHRTASALVFFVTLLLLSASRTVGQDRRVLVRLNNPRDSAEALRLFHNVHADPIDSIRLYSLRIYALNVPTGTNATTFCTRLRSSGLFAYALPDSIPARSAPLLQIPTQIITTGDSKHRNKILSGVFPPDDPSFKDQYYLLNDGTIGGYLRGADIGIEQAWQITEGSDNVVIAVDDQGIDADHPEFSGRFVNDSDQIAVMNNKFHHGTEVSGVMVANKNNGIGIAGIASQCKLLVVDSRGGTSLLAILKVLEKAVQWNVAVMNASWGTPSSNLQPLQEALDLVARNGRNGKGMLIVFASGNSGSPAVDFPSWYASLMSVGATTPSDGRAVFSNYGRELDVCAPGTEIVTTDSYNSYSRVGGTSLAAPIVTATAALVASANPALTADSIRAIIELTCDKTGGYFYKELHRHGLWSQYMGYGRVNAGRAVRMAKGMIDVSPRIISPRGNEIAFSGETYTFYWQTDRPAQLVLRSQKSGTAIKLASAAGVNTYTAQWTAQNAPDTVRLYVADAIESKIYDSLAMPIIVREHGYSVTIDTAAVFRSIDDELKAGKASFVKPLNGQFALPFDMVIGGDTVWAFDMSGTFSQGMRVNKNKVSRQVQPSFDPHSPSTSLVTPLFSDDMIGIDSIRFCVTGKTPDREAIIEYDGLYFDSLLYVNGPPFERSDYKFQLRFSERDGRIGFCYNSELLLRGDTSIARHVVGLAGLKTRNESLLPFGDEYAQRIPKGSVWFRPTTYTPLPLPPARAAIISSDPPVTYGYNVFSATVLANLPDTVVMESSRDGGLSWSVAATIPPSRDEARYVAPTQFAGYIFLRLRGAYDAGWRDTLEVFDHGYTIKAIPKTNVSLIAGDPRATYFSSTSSTVFFDDSLPFPFYYFGEQCTRAGIYNYGWVAPYPDTGMIDGNNLLKPYPRFNPDDPDSLCPIRTLTTRDGNRNVFIIEWDSLGRFSSSTPRRFTDAVQLRLYDDGVIEMHLFTQDSGMIPYYILPTISWGPYFLWSPDFSMRYPLTAPNKLPLGSYRFTPHTPISGVRNRGTAESASSGLRVYPNPGSGRIHITGLTGPAPHRVSVFNALGQPIARLSSGAGSIEWDSRDVVPGLYFVREERTGRMVEVVIAK